MKDGDANMNEPMRCADRGAIAACAMGRMPDVVGKSGVTVKSAKVLLGFRDCG
jgi:hypothetical protein